MSQRFKAKFPITAAVGPCSFNVREYPMTSKEEDALWHYNDSRAHDGLRPLAELPDGVVFEPIHDTP